MVQSDFEKSIRGHRGMSLDLGEISNPYLLPPEIQSSRESIHSLSRNVDKGLHDPYRPATTYNPRDGSLSDRSQRFDDGSSARTSSTGPRFGRDGMNSQTHLLANAQPYGSSPAPGLKSIGEDDKGMGVLQHPKLVHMPPPNRREPTIPRSQTASPEQKQGPGSPPSVHNFSRKQSLQSNNVPSITGDERPRPQAQGPPRPLNSRSNSQQPFSNLSSPNLDNATPFYTPTEEQFEQAPQPRMRNANGLGVANIAMENNRLSILRPLPPDDPNDSAEQRANRIRSFYKEYFKTDAPAQVYQPHGAAYYEDYSQEYLGDGTIYDPSSGQFIVAQAPYAEPVTRRAMTPPPRGPPRFQGRENQHNSSGPVEGRSRAFSTASMSRLGPGGPPGSSKHPMPPPDPLRTLPTPHLLREQDMFMHPIDFAPAAGFKDRAAGEPGSPRSEIRPYGPSVPIASALASSFSELPAMPSP